MSDIDNARQLHKILDRLAENNPLDSYGISQLRAALPELPKQKTLKEIYEFVDNAAYGTVRNVWRDDVHGDLAPFLHEVSSQLEGLINAEPAPTNTSALPAGMRIADHAVYGRVVVSPEMDENNEAYRIFYRDEDYVTDSFSRYVESSLLTFIDYEPAKPAPAHPKFLETQADYENAPEGTIVTKDDCHPWTKEDIDHWTLSGSSHSDHGMARSGRRYILRWGWGE